MERKRLGQCFDHWAGRTSYLLPFLPAALFALFPKWLLLRDEGFLIAARAAGHTVPNDRWQDTFDWIDRVAFFRDDFLLNFLVLPAALMLMAGLLRPRWRAPFVGAFSILLVLLVYADMLSLSNVGRLLSIPMIMDALRWGVGNPQFVSIYVSLSSVTKLLLILALVITLALWAHRTSRPPRHSPVCGPILLTFFVALPAITACTSACATIPATAFQQPALQQMFASLLGESRHRDEFDRLSPDQLRALFESETATRPSPRDPRYFGKATDHDLILFVFETGPSRSLDLEGDLSDFPNLRRLRRHALIGAAHHSTYPYTSRALYSILSGTYPVDAIDNYFLSAQLPRIPAWPQALHAEGYVTASYAPGHSLFTPDSAMLRSLGVAEEHVAEAEPTRSGDTWERTLARDRATLQMLLGDMERWLSAKRRYAAVFMPQAGHGPWHDLKGHGDDYPARGRALMALQDQWLGEIIALLERHGRLQQTIIAVTADHGVRTRSEDPRFTGGMIDDYSFHVPLLLWSPAAFPQPVTVRAVSSHVDLAPTLLDLLGSDVDRRTFHGMALWDPLLPGRRTFFFAKGYLGADGVHQDGRFFMTNYLFRSAYAAPRLAFGNQELIRADSTEADRLFEQMARIEAIRNSWIRRMADHQGGPDALAVGPP